MRENEKNKSGPLTRKEFLTVINRLKVASELADKVNELFRYSRENLECDFCNSASLQISHEGVVVSLLEKIMQDNGGNISYFIYELDYGKEYYDGCVTDDNGNVDFSTAENLYHYLIKNIEGDTYGR